eukprot:767339-Hanusia_phi.AAC.3
MQPPVEVFFQCGESATSQTLTGAKAGQAYYQNMCMKAVNQCIGRAIRHVADFAAIILVDSRYESSNVRCKVRSPATSVGLIVNQITSWIRDKLTAQSPTTFGPCYQRQLGTLPALPRTARAKGRAKSALVVGPRARDDGGG